MIVTIPQKKRKRKEKKENFVCYSPKRTKKFILQNRRTPLAAPRKKSTPSKNETFGFLIVGVDSLSGALLAGVGGAPLSPRRKNTAALSTDGVSAPLAGLGARAAASRRVLAHLVVVVVVVDVENVPMNQSDPRGSIS